MDGSDSWHTPDGLLIRIPKDALCGVMLSKISIFDVQNFLGARLDNSYNFSRILRTISMFAAFFATSYNLLYTFLISLGAFLLGYLCLFTQDHFPFTFAIDFLGIIYAFMFKFFVIIPVAVIITAIITKSYWLILLYVSLLLASLLLRYIIDLIYLRVSKKIYGISLVPVEAKALHIAHHYGKTIFTKTFRSFVRFFLKAMRQQEYI